MSTGPRIKFYLIHLETGQRYPVLNEDLIIGRSSGDILFPADEGLSQQHCRLVLKDGGLSIHDLGSHNGTRVNEKRLRQNRLYRLKAGAIIRAGAQEFKIHETSIAKRVKTARLRRHRKKKRNDLFSSLIVFACLIGALAIFTQWHRRRSQVVTAPVKIVSPYEMVEKEVRDAFNQYKILGEEHTRGEVTGKNFVAAIRQHLIPAFQTVQVKLQVVIPDGELERRRLEVHRKLVDALIHQLNAMADDAERKTPKNSKALETYSQEVEKLSREAKALKRQPAQVW